MIYLCANCQLFFATAWLSFSAWFLKENLIMTNIHVENCDDEQTGIVIRIKRVYDKLEREGERVDWDRVAARMHLQDACHEALRTQAV